MQLSNASVPTTGHVGRFVGSPEDRDVSFVDLLDAYRASAGLARASDVASMLRRGNDRGIVTVARWVAAGQVVHFKWNGEYWLPLFQFTRPCMAPLPQLQRVISVLAPVLDAWDTAVWFTRPNDWLGGARPVDLAARQAVQVERAAHADRIAFGN